MRHLIFDPSIPLALWCPLAAGAVALLVWYAVLVRRRLPRRRWGLAIGLMTVGAAIPLAILLNPVWIQRIPRPEGKPLLTILVDQSASMETRDAVDGRSRFEQAAALARSATTDLAERYDMRIRSFADDWSQASPQSLATLAPDGATTNLASAIDGALDESCVQGQAILLLSDGVHNASGGTFSVREAVSKARVLAAPVYVHTVGGSAAVDDLEVALNLPQELGFVGQRVPVTVTITHRGNLAASTTLSLLRNGEVVDTRDVTLTPDGSAEEQFDVSEEQAGLYRYEIQAETSSDEVTSVNNTAALLLRVVDEPVRVLLLEGKPYWDTKFLMRKLAADPSIELVSIVKMAEGRLLQRTVTHVRNEDESSASPTAADGQEKADPDSAVVQSDQWVIREDAAAILADPDALSKYQVVILGRSADDFLSEEAVMELRKWLAEGNGSLVCFRGSPSSEISQRLGQLMPVRWTATSETRFRVQLTEAGRALRWLPPARDNEDVLAALPSLASVNRIDRPKPLATVLATTATAGTGEAVPVVAYQPVGNGRVVVVEGAGMWRWAFLPPGQQAGDEVYGMLWRSLTRWLVSNVGLLPSQRLALRTDRVTFGTEESVTATMLLRKGEFEADIPEVELTGPDDEKIGSFEAVPLGEQLGEYQLRFGRLPEGRYAARVAGAEQEEIGAATWFDVRGNLTERLDVSARPELMKQIALGSGGEVLEKVETGELAGRFEEHLRRTQPERTVQEAAWDRWWILVGAFLLWGATWGLRRWSGLV